MTVKMTEQAPPEDVESSEDGWADLPEYLLKFAKEYDFTPQQAKALSLYL